MHACFCRRVYECVIVIVVVDAIFFRITYFVHGSYDSVAAFDDGNVNGDWGDLIKVFCDAVKQVIFKFSPTVSWSVTRIELNIIAPGAALSKTSVSYGTWNIHV